MSRTPIRGGAVWIHRVTAAVCLACMVLPGQGEVVVVAADRRVGPSRLGQVEQLADRGIARLAPLLPGTPRRPITIVVHRDADSVPRDQLAGLHTGVPGYARLQRDEIHLILSEIQIDPPNDLRTTVDHELVHILLDQHVGVNGLHVPRWFHEGLAQVLSGGVYLGVREEDLAYRVFNRSYIPFARLCDGFPGDDPAALALAYGQSFSFVAFLQREVGLEPLLAVARDCGPDLPFNVALARRLKKAQIEFEVEWRDYILKSGSGYAVVLRNCFLLTIVAVGPLLALAVARRRNKEEALKQRMQQEERAAEAASAGELPAGEFDEDDDAPFDDDAFWAVEDEESEGGDEGWRAEEDEWRAGRE